MEETSARELSACEPHRVRRSTLQAVNSDTRETQNDLTVVEQFLNTVQVGFGRGAGKSSNISTND